MKQLIFITVLILTSLLFTYTLRKILFYFKLTQPFKVNHLGKRLLITLKVAIGQTKIMRFPLAGIMHALVFWGFLVITLGSVEMIVDGITGHERTFAFTGLFYKIIIGTGDVFAYIVAAGILFFLARRIFISVKRFKGVEMKKISKIDANAALTMILLLMISLIGTNIFYIQKTTAESGIIEGIYPISSYISMSFNHLSLNSLFIFHEINWWAHILLIFAFANLLPYSKHFHVFMSIPNVFFSATEPLGKLYNMENVTKEVKLMMNPDTAFAATSDTAEVPQRFGVLDIEDITWKNYMDSLACTECGRCTSVCPANITGKLLSPRKILIDTRARMKEKGNGIMKNGATFSDNKSLINNYITAEELWACTTCNACAQECPININHPRLIVDMRRYLVMEQSAAPAGLNAAFQNIENNGAPWQFSALDRMLWADNLEFNGKKVMVRTIEQCTAENKNPEYLLWVGSAGAFDDRYKKVMQAFVKILIHCNVEYAVLGTSESDSGDVARRAGNEMLFQMQALTNIEILNSYGIKKIVTCDPHDFNTLKNEYPDLGGNYQVLHHTEFLELLINQGILKPSKSIKSNITYHDPCYLGRGNTVYQAPRNVLKAFSAQITEMKRSKSNALCCGAGGGQMFKEAEKGTKEVFIERTEEVINTKVNTVITACPFCMTMISDGIKYKNATHLIKNLDICEYILEQI